MSSSRDSSPTSRKRAHGTMVDLSTAASSTKRQLFSSVAPQSTTTTVTMARTTAMSNTQPCFLEFHRRLLQYLEESDVDNLSNNNVEERVVDKDKTWDLMTLFLEKRTQLRELQQKAYKSKGMYNECINYTKNMKNTKTVSNLSELHPTAPNTTRRQNPTTSANMLSNPDNNNNSNSSTVDSSNNTFMIVARFLRRQSHHDEEWLERDRVDFRKLLTGAESRIGSLQNKLDEQKESLTSMMTQHNNQPRNLNNETSTQMLRSKIAELETKLALWNKLVYDLHVVLA